MALLKLVARRSTSRWRLMSLVTVGLVIAVALIASVPLFTNGALDRVLQKELAAQESGLPEQESDLPEQESDLPLASILVTHRVGLSAPTTLEQYRRADSFMRKDAATQVGLTGPRITRYGSTRVREIVLLEDRSLPSDQRRSQSAGLAFLTGLEKHVEIVKGSGFMEGGADGPGIEALVSERFYYDHDVQVGDRLLYGLDNPPALTPIEVKIVGVWRPADADPGFWFEEPDAFAFYLIVPEGAFLDEVAPLVPDAVRTYAWFLVFDTGQMRMDNVERALRGIENIRTRMGGMLSFINVTVPVYEMLEEFSARATTLRTFLLVLSTPVLVILLAYIVISFDMVVGFERDEIAMLKSRGASGIQILLLYLLETILVGGLGMGSGLMLAVGVAQLLGQVYRFLTIAVRPLLRISLSPQAIQYAGAATLLCIGATLWPAVGAASHTIVSHRQRAARGEIPSRAGHRARVVLELAFVSAALYGSWMLKERGGGTSQPINSTLMDPLVVLAPVLFSVALTLLTLRILPLLANLIARASERSLGLSASLAMRQIARQPGTYRPVLFLLVITVALGLFSASFAGTLDNHHSDASYYEVGTDLLLRVQWERLEGVDEQPVVPSAVEESGATRHLVDVDALLQEQLERAEAVEMEEQTLVRWRHPPFEAVHTVPGIAAAARVLRAEAYLEGTIGRASGMLLGIDRAEFGKAAWWREDLARESLGGLMNALAQDPAGLLVGRAFAEETGLQEGNELFLVVEGADRPTYFAIKGVVDYFPTLYPEEGTFFVGNLDYIYDSVGMQPYDIWARLSDGASSSAIVSALRERGFLITEARDTRMEVAAWRTDPQSTALFGMLSMGFVVAIVISSLGFLLYSFLSLRQRLPNFGVLRALGLSVRQLTAVVVYEELFLGLLGAAGGTLIGTLTARTFIPLLQAGAVTQGTTPPFLVTPAWGQMIKVYAFFGLTVLATLGVLVWQLVRLRVYEALKLGSRE